MDLIDEILRYLAIGSIIAILGFILVLTFPSSDSKYIYEVYISQAVLECQNDDSQNNGGSGSSTGIDCLEKKIEEIVDSRENTVEIAILLKNEDGQNIHKFISNYESSNQEEYIQNQKVSACQSFNSACASYSFRDVADVNKEYEILVL